SALFLLTNRDQVTQRYRRALGKKPRSQDSLTVRHGPSCRRFHKSSSYVWCPSVLLRQHQHKTRFFRGSTPLNRFLIRPPRFVVGRLKRRREGGGSKMLLIGETVLRT